MKKFIHVVGAIIENENEEIFCALRSSTMSLPNLWEFPGGKIESNESPEEAIKREINEEFLCDIDVFEKIEDTTHDYGTFVVRLETYKAKLLNSEPVAQEHAETRWVKKSDLSKLTFAPADIPAVNKIMNK